MVHDRFDPPDFSAAGIKRQKPDKIGVVIMIEITSETGISIRRSGRYELVAEYNKTTGHDIGGMAILIGFSVRVFGSPKLPQWCLLTLADEHRRSEDPERGVHQQAEVTLDVLREV